MKKYKNLSFEPFRLDVNKCIDLRAAFEKSEFLISLEADINSVFKYRTSRAKAWKLVDCIFNTAVNIWREPDEDYDFVSITVPTGKKGTKERSFLILDGVDPRITKKVCEILERTKLFSLLKGKKAGVGGTSIAEEHIFCSQLRVLPEFRDQILEKYGKVHLKKFQKNTETEQVKNTLKIYKETSNKSKLETTCQNQTFDMLLKEVLQLRVELERTNKILQQYISKVDMNSAPTSWEVGARNTCSGFSPTIMWAISEKHGGQIQGEPTDACVDAEFLGGQIQEDTGANSKVPTEDFSTVPYPLNQDCGLETFEFKGLGEVADAVYNQQLAVLDAVDATEYIDGVSPTRDYIRIKSPVGKFKSALRHVCSKKGDTHGRFYHPLINIKREFRKHIVVNGKPTVEVDFKSSHPSIAFALCGFDLKQYMQTNFGGRDFYDCYLGSDKSKEKVAKSYAKLLYMRLQNAVSEGTFRNNLENSLGRTGYIGSVDKELKELHDKLGRGTADAILKELEKRCQPIKSLLFQYGKLDDSQNIVYVESEITKLIIEKFQNRGKFIMPIHDSFVVLEEDKDMLEKTMKAAFFIKTKQYPYGLK